MANKKTNLEIILTATDRISKVVDTAVNRATKRLNALSAASNKIAQGAFAVGRSMGIMGAAIALPLVSMVKAAEESATANARLDQVFRSMGETSGYASEQAKKLAKSLQMEIAVDDEKILAAQAKLATFEKVIKTSTGTTEIFDRATRAAFDLQAAGFGDATSNVVQLGKALNDPIKGMTALTRSGITFNKTEEAKIKSLVASGKTLDAQRIILKAVEKQVGGVAKATANDSDRMVVAFGEIKETLGAALLPALAQLTNWVTGTALPAFSNFAEANQPLIKAVLLATAVIGGLSLTISAGAFVFGGIMKIVSITTAVFGGLTTAIGFVTTAIRIMSVALLTNPIGLIVTGIAVGALLIYKYWTPISAFFVKLGNGIAWVFTNIMGAARNALGYVGRKISEIGAFISNVGQVFYNAGYNISTSIWNGIKGGWKWITDGMGNLVQGIRNYLPFSPAKEGPLKDLHRIKFVETMMQGFNPQPAFAAVSNMAGGMAGIATAPNVPTPTSAGSSGGVSMGGGVTVNFSPTVTISGGGTEQDKQNFISLLNTYKIDLLRIIRDEQAKQDRKKY